jgi:hypothetical protein
MIVRSGRTTSTSTCGRPVGRPRQQGHMVQLDNDKCQVELAFQVRANHESK